MRGRPGRGVAQLPAELPQWVADPSLDPLWERVAARLEANGLTVAGRVTVTTPGPLEQRAVGDLVGRRVTSTSCRVDLVLLDERLRLRAGLGGGVVEAAARRVGRPLADRPGDRNDAHRLREVPFRAADERLRGSPLAGQSWVEPWLAAVRLDGLLRRYRDPEGALLGAIAVLERTTAAGTTAAGTTAAGTTAAGTTWARTELAAQLLHDAHGLDDGTPVSRLVLRALGTRSGTTVPAHASGRAELWESAGVVADSVSSTCLTLGLPWLGDGRRQLAWRQAADDGDPVHVTAWDLVRASPRLPSGLDVLICENPRVLEAHAQRFGGSRPVVCTAGRPNLVVQRVLSACAAAGSTLRYHGDFDWAGVAIAHQVMDLCGAVPWRMSADDYLRADGFLPLEGRPVDPRWDADLGAAMRHRGVSVHEEAVLDQIC